MTRLLILLVVLIAACAQRPIAPDADLRLKRTQRASDLFIRFDRNKDGVLSREELSGGLREISLGFGGPHDLLYGMKRDSKKAGSEKAKTPRPLTKEEIAKAVEEAFKVRDDNLDERLSQDEFKKLIVERPAAPDDTDPWEPFM